MSDDEILAVVQAHKEGKKIQYRNYPCSDWEDFVGAAAVWCFCGRDYRIAPGPRKPRNCVGKTGRKNPYIQRNVYCS